MDLTTSARTRARGSSRPTAVGWIAVAVALGIAGCQPASPSPGGIGPGGGGVSVTEVDDGVIDEADGVLPEGVTPMSDSYPGIAELEPALLDALRQAAADAGDDGISVVVTSGWRSAAYQNQLLTEAVAEYGSAEEAARWVATAETSAHVSGDAVDVGPYDAMSWLSQHGAGYGLCQIYGNEPWHFELRPEAIEQGCPRMYTDPTEDPRLQH